MSINNVINKMRETISFSRINKSKVFYVLINIIFFTFWFIFTHRTQLASDDFSYQVIFGTGDKVKNIFDVVYSQYRHYFIWSGRSVAHFLDQLYLIYDKIYFDISNAMVFIITCNLIYSLRKDRELNNSLFLIICLNYWFFGGDVRRGMLWQTGSFNYLWMIMFSLIFIKKYYTIFDKNITENPNIFSCILFFLFSIIAGWGHEIISPVILLALFLYFIYKYQNKIKFLNIEVAGFLGYTIGTTFLILAPGNFQRVNDIRAWAFATLPLALRYVASFVRNGYYFIHYTAPAIILTMVIAYFAHQNNKISNNKNDKLKVPFYLFILFVSVFFYFFIFGWQSTNVLIPLTILNIMLVRLYYDIKDNKIETIVNFCSYFMLLVFMLQAAVTLYVVFTRNAEVVHSFKLY